MEHEITRFTFKNEAIWMVIFSVAPLAIALVLS